MDALTLKSIIYVRVSSVEQVSGTSLDNQKQACLEYAANKGFRVMKIFIEKGESATAINRTELIKALDYCRDNKGQITAFVVWKIDRFARSTIDHYGLQAQLIKYGTTLHSVTEPIGEGPIGRMTEAVLAGYAQFENDVRKMRCEGGMRRKISDGIWCWQPPIGYIHAKKISDRRKIRPDEVDPERFYIIQKGLKLYTEGGYTITSLTEFFNKAGLQTRTKRPMFKQLVERMLKNKYYCGILTDPWTHEEFKGLHQPMITIEEFRKIQFIKSGLSHNTAVAKHRLHQDFPLRQFITCECGQNLTGSWQTGRSKRYAYYRCNNKICQHYALNTKKEELDQAFYEFLLTIRPQQEFISQFSRTVVENWYEQKTLFQQERHKARAVLDQLETEKEKLIMMRANNELTPKEYAKIKDKIDNKITSYQIVSNENRIEELNIETALEYTSQFLNSIARLWLDIQEPKQKQRLQKLVLPHGLSYHRNTHTFGTAVLSPVFSLSHSFTGNESDLVAGLVRL